MAGMPRRPGREAEASRGRIKDLRPAIVVIVPAD
jgi:hypothetical protein